MKYSAKYLTQPISKASQKLLEEVFMNIINKTVKYKRRKVCLSQVYNKSYGNPLDFISHSIREA